MKSTFLDNTWIIDQQDITCSYFYCIKSNKSGHSFQVNRKLIAFILQHILHRYVNIEYNDYLRMKLALLYSKILPLPFDVNWLLLDGGSLQGFVLLSHLCPLPVSVRGTQLEGGGGCLESALSGLASFKWVSLLSTNSNFTYLIHHVTIVNSSIIK